MERNAKEPTDSRLVWEAVAQASHSVALTEIWSIRKRAVAVGMSQCSVIAALGLPSRVNRTRTARDETSQWVYDRRGAYVYVREGMVYAVQD